MDEVPFSILKEGLSMQMNRHHWALLGLCLVSNPALADDDDDKKMSSSKMKNQLLFEVEGEFGSETEKQKVGSGDETTESDSSKFEFSAQLIYKGSYEKDVNWYVKVDFDKGASALGDGSQEAIKNAWIEHQVADMLSLKWGRQDSFHAILSNDDYYYRTYNDVFGGDTVTGESANSEGFVVSGLGIKYSPVEQTVIALQIGNSLTLQKDTTGEVDSEMPLIGIGYIGNYGGIMPFFSYYVDPVEEKEDGATEIKETENTYLSLGVMGEMMDITAGIEFLAVTKGGADTVTGGVTTEVEDTEQTDLNIHLGYEVADFEPSVQFNTGTSKTGDLEKDWTKFGVFVGYEAHENVEYFASFSQAEVVEGEGDAEVTETETEFAIGIEAVLASSLF